VPEFAGKAVGAAQNAAIGDMPAGVPPPIWLLAYGLALWSFAEPLEEAS